MRYSKTYQMEYGLMYRSHPHTTPVRPSQRSSCEANPEKGNAPRKTSWTVQPTEEMTFSAQLHLLAFGIRGFHRGRHTESNRIVYHRRLVELYNPGSLWFCMC
jgi:hypothetical protein